jgi:Flp pilus assembly protein TadG
VTRDDRGQALALELVLAIPVVLAMVSFVVYAGRQTTAAQRLADTAQAAARAASQSQDFASAEAAARAAVSAAVPDVSCTSAPTVSVGWTPGPGGGWPGSSVEVEVACTVPNDSLSPIWVPGARTVRGADRQVVDRFQEG